jgi:hypothetical protein
MSSSAPSLLVSFCNFAHRPRPTGLLRVDTATWRSEWVDIGCGQFPRVSGTGICADEQFVYHVSIAEAEHATTLTVLNRASLEVVYVQDLAEVSDGHSVVRYGNGLVIASTGSDELVGYRLDGCHPVDAHVVWSPTHSGTDLHHLNSLAAIDGDLMCSAFGARSGDSWVTARDGYVFNVSRQTTVTNGLDQPHSVTWAAGELCVCNSALGTVQSTGRVIARLAGYSRGLAFTADAMYVATSLGRTPGIDAGAGRRFMNPSADGTLIGRCAVVRVPLDGGARLEIGLGFAGAEIYDLLVH